METMCMTDFPFNRFYPSIPLDPFIPFIPFHPLIRVLVADDSFFMRKLIGDILSADPGIEVVGTAADGGQAVRMAGELRPDVITMDLDMPGVSGLDATKRIMQGEGARPIVVMVSAFTKDKADETLECLKAGAFDCILKPSGPLSLDIERVEDELRSRVKAAAASRKPIVRSQAKHVPKPSAAGRSGVRDRHLIVIGASTGGPPVIEDILSQTDSSLRSPILIVQHMPEAFTASFASRLDRVCPLKVKLAENGESLKNAVAFLAPGNHHLRLSKEGADCRLSLSRDEPVKGLRPSYDVLLESVAEHFKGSVLAIILTGMGDDGRNGVMRLKKRGATVIVQDPATCAVDGMVGAVIEDGNADEVLAPADIAARIQSFSSSRA